MNEQDNSRKSYFLGLLTGCIIAAFILCLVLIIKVIVGEGAATDSRGRMTAKPTAPQTQTTQDPVQVPAPDGLVAEDQAVLDKMNYIEDLIDKEFIDSVSNDALQEGIYDGMMSALKDPYAEYYTPEEWIEMQQDTQGIYYGIGAYLTKDEDTLYPRITGIIKNTPAEETGLQEDDYIVEIEGEDTYNWDLSDVVSHIKGPEGTKVHLTISRKENGNRVETEYDVERRRVETPTVEYEMKEDSIAYIAISEFDTVTIDQFAEALSDARSDGMKAMVLDLRSNPGGSLQAVVEIARMILPKGRIVYTEDKYGVQESFDCDGKYELDVPLAVLVNGNSASASEILSGAIKDYGLGTLVGTTTFGKGIVQQLFRLTDGSAVKLTVSHYYTPNGNDIHKVGIEPDVEVEFDADAYREDKTDNQLDKAMEILKKKLP
ncbi:MAG: S41 family peptidase [Lachnospiraceae bacterium]|nr:S41 family peptidase [Lachnospiraceae bacterium]